jgi:hypothetical protein
VVAEIPALLAEGKRIRVAVPTNRLAREVLAAVRRAIVDAGDITSTCGNEPKRTSGNCGNFAAVNAARRAAGPGGAGMVCRACDLHPRQSGPGACRFFAEKAAGAYDVTVTTHALEVSRARWGGEDDDEAPPPDVLVIDEAPRAADAQYTVSYRDLCAWRGARDLEVDDAAFASLRALLSGARDARHAVSGAELAEALPRGAVTARRDEEGRVVSSLGWGLVDAHAAEAARGAMPEALATAPEAEALEALEVACRNGWRGCYVSREGELHLTLPLSPAGPAATTFYLDGTATEASAKALFGPECRFERLRVALHPETRVAQVSWSAAKRALPPAPPDDDDDTPAATRARRERVRAKRSETLTRLAAVVGRYESDATAWVLHKAWCEDAAVRELLPDAFETGRAIHYRSAEATGSNGLAACSRIVLADFFMRRDAIAARAETLALRAGEAASPDVDWWGEALHLLETSERVQAAHRVRPGAEVREIVWLCERELPAGVDWPAAVDVDADELVFDELGVYPEGREGAALLLRRAVADSPAGVVVPSGDATWTRAREAWSQDGRSVAWAAFAGVSLAYARASDGSTPVVFHARGTDPTPEAVASAVVASRAEGGPPLAWVEWSGVRVSTGPSAEGEGTRLLALLRTLPASERATFEALASLSGVSARTVRRRLHPLGVVSLADLERLRGTGEAEPLPSVTAEAPGETLEQAAPARAGERALPLPQRKQAQGTSYSLTPLGRGRDAGAYPGRAYVRGTYHRRLVS